MATIPKIVTLTNSSVDVLNVIRNNATQNYRDYVPKATPDAESIREIGTVIMDYPSLQNEFLSALVNRIGRVIITSKMYENPLKNFKKGMLEYGETVEEIFVNLAEPFQYNPEESQSTVFKMEKPDVKSAFHVLNFQKYYKSTVKQPELRLAFLSWNGVTDLITKIIDSMYSGASYDEFQVMKYMIAKNISRGQMYPVTVPTVDTENMKQIVSTIKGVSNAFEFMNSKYNLAGVRTFSKKDSQYILVNSKFDATMDVEVLATAFNMSKAEFMGNRVLVDGFGELDNERLATLFKDDSSYSEISEEELKAINNIPAVMVDRDWFMIFDNMVNFTEQYNGEGLYWNYWYHTWKTFSVSPFAQNVMFIPGTPTVTSVTLSPETLTIGKGQVAYFSATVDTENFAQQVVNWTVNSEKSFINSSGKLVVGEDETKTTLTVTATSNFDETKKGTATVTIA